MLISRHLQALPPAMLATFVLLFAMQALINQGTSFTNPPVTQAPPAWQKPVEPPPEKTETLPDREWITPADVPGFHVPQNDLNVDPIKPRPVYPDMPRQGFDSLAPPSTQDQPLVATIRIAPIYPPTLAARGVEGFVDVVFDVLPSGMAVNIAVVESSHRGFEKAAVEAARRFQFQARVVDGSPVLTTNVGYRFRFEMDSIRTR